MISTSTPLGYAHTVQSTSELPLPRSGRVYLDVETTSFDSKVSPFRPYHGHRIAGVAVTWDSEGCAWYVPARHTRSESNLPLSSFQAWLRDVLGAADEWVNHNIKFDAHFCLQDGAEHRGKFHDTLVTAKLLYSDRMSHELKGLCREWCSLPMVEELEVKAWLADSKSKNYGDVPADMLGRYACMDVLGNRTLAKHIEEHLPAEVRPLKEMEHSFTRVLLDIEREGMRVDKSEVKLKLRESLVKLVSIADRLQELTGREYSDSPKNNYELLCCQYGLPVLKYNEPTKTRDEPGPSFDKEAMQLYRAHPAVLASPKLAEIVGLLSEFRDEHHHKSTFLDAYLELADDRGVVHPSYNQVVRTGRTSCSEPNFQGISPRARELVHPPPGEAFVSMDASQVEFRFMVHYIKDQEAIAAYCADPRTDFHAWVAKLCSISRRAAKTANFAMGYGAGKAKITKLLAGNPDVMEEIGEQVRVLIEEGRLRAEDADLKYRELCERRASEIYLTYHERLPGIKQVSVRAANDCVRRGYVFNIWRRRRYLPPKASRKAFNSAVQGGAMDMIKERLVAVSPAFRFDTRAAGIRIAGVVHDEVLFVGSREALEQEAPKLRAMLEDPAIKLRVPIVWDCGRVCETNWKEAAGK